MFASVEIDNVRTGVYLEKNREVQKPILSSSVCKPLGNDFIVFDDSKWSSLLCICKEENIAAFKTSQKFALAPGINNLTLKTSTI